MIRALGLKVRGSREGGLWKVSGFGLRSEGFRFVLVGLRFGVIWA